MRTLTILSASILTALAACAPASAATISPTGVRFPQAAVNARGTTLVAWERTSDKYALEVRTGRSPLHLGSTQRLSRSGYQAQVAVGGDGTMAVAWLEYGDHGSRSLRAAVAGPGERLGKGQLLDRRVANMAPLGVTVQPNGRVVALWRRSGSQLAFAMATPNKAFGHARDVTAMGSNTGSIALDPRDGAVVLAYGTPPSFGPPPVNQQAAVRTLSPSATAFSAPTVLTATGPGTGPLNEARPIAVSGPGGNGVAYSLSGEPSSLNIARRGADGAWLAAEHITTTNYGENMGAAGLRATLPAGGAAIAAWSIATESPDGLGGVVSSRNVASIAQAGAPFGPPQALTPDGGRFGAAAVASAGGEGFVASAAPRGPVLVATRAAGATGLRTRTIVARGDGDIALAAGGRHVLAIYQQRDRLRLTVVR